MDIVQAHSINQEPRIRDFFELLKPRVMSLVVFSGFAGMFIAPGFSELHPFLAVIAMLCLAVGAGASGAINMWYDRDIDQVMKRTRNRPIPTGRIDSNEALAFAIVLSLASFMVMGLALNWFAAGVLAFASFFYVVIYTMWLKRSTSQNIVIGGAAGAFPPIVGWVAVTGELSWYPILLFLVIFFWTPPHFWALSLFANEDYKRASIPMMTVTAGLKHTKRQMLLYTFILTGVCVMPYVWGYASFFYLLGSLGLNGLFVLSAVRVYQRADMKFAKAMFGYSVFYLFAYFILVMLTSIVT